MVERVKEIYLTNGCHITKGKRERESKCFKESSKTTLSVSESANYSHFMSFGAVGITSQALDINILNVLFEI
jgi:hypothetical protein